MGSVDWQLEGVRVALEAHGGPAAGEAEAVREERGDDRCIVAVGLRQRRAFSGPKPCEQLAPVEKEGHLRPIYSRRGRG